MKIYKINDFNQKFIFLNWKSTRCIQFETNELTSREKKELLQAKENFFDAHLSPFVFEWCFRQNRLLTDLIIVRLHLGDQMVGITNAILRIDNRFQMFANLCRCQSFFGIQLKQPFDDLFSCFGCFAIPVKVSNC